MPGSAFYDGQTATNPATGEKIVYQGGRWHQAQQTPQGAKLRPDVGAGAYETREGAVMRAGPNGGLQTLIPPQMADASARTRLQLGLGPAVEAQKAMYASEGWTGGAKNARNPYDAHPFAEMAEAVPWDGGFVARKVGGNDYQGYQQAAKTWEAAILPILSGSAVTPSEARRQMLANLPQPGDTPHILAQKATNRARMMNAAASLIGKERPFPRVPDWTGGDSAPQSKGGGFEIVGVRDH